MTTTKMYDYMEVDSYDESSDHFFQVQLATGMLIIEPTGTFGNALLILSNAIRRGEPMLISPGLG